MKLEKRIRVLESRLLSDPVVLRFADGNEREMRWPFDYLMDLFVTMCDRREFSAEEAVDLDLIGHCVSAKELGGGRLVELLKAGLESLVASPAASLPCVDRQTRVETFCRDMRDLEHGQ